MAYRMSAPYRTTIKTGFGKRKIARRVGVAGQYALTLPTPSAPNGEWWTLSFQGWVPCPGNSRALLDALALEDGVCCERPAHDSAR